MFRELHQSGCFVLPNPANRGAAVVLASMGFKALATTSAGLAFDRARPDTPTALSRDTVLDNVREIVEATDLPVNADFQAGYGETPQAVAQSVRACVQTGVAGLSIEDASGSDALFELDEAVARLAAAREAIDASGRDVVLTGRAECFLVEHPDPLAESIRRLQAYAEAGADCLYAPGLRTADEIEAVVRAVAPKPVNVLLADPANMTVANLADLGVRRISVGSALARVAWGAFIRAAQEMAEHGTFDALRHAEPFATFNNLFTD